MKKQYLLLAAVAVIVGLGSFVGAKHFSQSGNNVVSAGPELNENGKTIHQVYLKDDKASPDTLAVQVGESVQFNTADGLTHYIGLGGGGHSHKETGDGDLKSGQFGPGESYRVMIKKSGTFQFHDHEHANINVLVVAYEPKR